MSEQIWLSERSAEPRSAFNDDLYRSQEYSGGCREPEARRACIVEVFVMYEEICPVGLSNETLLEDSKTTASCFRESLPVPEAGLFMDQKLAT